MKALARRSAIPVELDTRLERRLPESVEVTAYFVAFGETMTIRSSAGGGTTMRVALPVRDG
jgi:hypothetical protein